MLETTDRDRERKREREREKGRMGVDFSKVRGRERGNEDEEFHKAAGTRLTAPRARKRRTRPYVTRVA